MYLFIKRTSFSTYRNTVDLLHFSSETQTKRGGGIYLFIHMQISEKRWEHSCLKTIINYFVSPRGTAQLPVSCSPRFESFLPLTHVLSEWHKNILPNPFPLSSKSALRALAWHRGDSRHFFLPPVVSSDAEERARGSGSMNGAGRYILTDCLPFMNIEQYSERERDSSRRSGVRPKCSARGCV